MYRRGHQGLNLLLFAPIGGGLALAGYPALAILGLVYCSATASAPDIDHRLPLISHRGITHTVWAVIGGAAVGAALFGGGLPLFGVGRSLAVTFGAGVGAYSIAGHLLGDMLTPMGVMPFAPVSNWTVSARLAPADSVLLNTGTFLLGVFVTIAVGIVVLQMQTGSLPF